MLLLVFGKLLFSLARLLLQSTNKQENITIEINLCSLQFARHVALETLHDVTESLAGSGDANESLTSDRREREWEELPVMVVLSRETHHCSKNSTRNNIGRRRTWNFSYSVVISMTRLVAGWNIVAGALELWQEFVNETKPTFGAVTFFTRCWWIHEKFHFPGNRIREKCVFVIKNLKGCQNKWRLKPAKWDWKVHRLRYLTTQFNERHDHIISLACVRFQFQSSWDGCNWEFCHITMKLRSNWRRSRETSNPSALLNKMISCRRTNDFPIIFYSALLNLLQVSERSKSIRASHKRRRIHFDLIST